MGRRRGSLTKETMAWLDNTQGLIEPDEGRRLAMLARYIDPIHSIVEVGSHTGLSSCWLAAGSTRWSRCADLLRRSLGRAETRIEDDPWELGADGVLERFKSNVSGTTQEVDNESYWDLITPLRTTSVAASSIWIKPIGLLFIDANPRRRRGAG